MFDRADIIIDSIPIIEVINYYEYFTSRPNCKDDDYKVHMKAKIRDNCSHSKIRLKGKKEKIIMIQSLFRFYNSLSWLNCMVDKYNLSANLKYKIGADENTINQRLFGKVYS